MMPFASSKQIKSHPNTVTAKRFIPKPTKFSTLNQSSSSSKPQPLQSASKACSRSLLWLGLTSDSEPKDQGVSKDDECHLRLSHIPRKSSPPFISNESVGLHNIPMNIVVQKAPKKKPSLSNLAPHIYLESLLRTRGYSTDYYDVLNSAYYNQPTPLQEASYGSYIVDLVRRNDDVALGKLLSLGLHPNACNSFGESLVHLACRRGNCQVLKTLIDFKCNVQVSDEYGRTPLHELCWSSEPSFEAATMILKIDCRLLFLKDCRGASPLVYARREHWGRWIKFFELKKNDFWPILTGFVQGPPTLTEHQPNSMKLMDMEIPFSLRLVQMIASGKILPDEAEKIREEGRRNRSQAYETPAIDYDLDFDDSDLSISSNIINANNTDPMNNTNQL